MWKLACRMAMKTSLKSIRGTIGRRCQGSTPSAVTAMPICKALPRLLCIRRWLRRRQCCGTGGRRFADLFRFILTAKFSAETSSATNLFSATMFMIDLRTAQLTATKAMIYLMDWLTCQNVSSVRVIIDDVHWEDFPLDNPSHSRILFIVPRSTHCCVVSTFLRSFREVYWEAWGPPPWQGETWKLHDSRADTRSAA